MNSPENENIETETAAPPPVTASRRRKILNALLGERAGYVFILIAAAVLGYLFLGCGMRFFLVPSRSMEPTLYSGDYLLTLKPAAYRRGDVVVLQDREVEGGYLVKRIVGVGGDSLKIEDGALYINGLYASEPYIAEPMTFSVSEPVTVPSGEVFVMGDNRNFSEDSASYIGHHPTFPEAELVGVVRFVYYPPARWGNVLSFDLVNLAGK